MSQRIIEVPGRGSYKFPSSMTDEEIAQAFQDNFPEWFNDQGPAYGPEEPPPEPPSKASSQRRSLRLHTQIGEKGELALTPEQLIASGKTGTWQQSHRSIEATLDNLDNLHAKRQSLQDNLDQLKQNPMVAEPGGDKVLKQELLGAIEAIDKEEQNKSNFLKRWSPTQVQYDALIKKTKKHNELNHEDLKTPEMMAAESKGLEGMLFQRDGDGFDLIRERYNKRDEAFKNYLEEARKNPEPTADYVVQRFPGIGGIISFAEALKDRGAAKTLEKSPPEEYDYDYDMAIKEMAMLTAYMEHQQGKEWFKKGSVIPGQKTWDILSMVPGYAAEFYLTGGVFTGGKTAAAKGAEKLLSKSVQDRIAASTVGRLASKSGKFTAGAGAQTLANPQLILRNLGHELDKDIQFESDPATGNMTWKVDDVDLGLDLQKAYVYSLAEMGTERLGEAFANLKAFKGMNSAMNEWKLLNPGRHLRDFKDLAAKAGYQGPLPEVMEERANELATYLYDLHLGEEELSMEAIDRRFTSPAEEGFYGELIAFTLFGVGLKAGQTAYNSVELEKGRVAHGQFLLEKERNKWDANTANLALQTNPEFTGLRDHTGRVLLFEDSNRKVLPVKIGDSKDELTSSRIATMAQNPGLKFRGAFHLKAGKPSEVVNATWEQADGTQAHTFNSMDDVRSYSKALVEAGNEQAARQIMTQAYEQLAPKPEVKEVKLDDTTVDRQRLMKSKIRLAELERMLPGWKVTDTDYGYRMEDKDGVRLDAIFKDSPKPGDKDWNAEKIIDSALGQGGITQEQVDQADTAEKREALALTVDTAGMFTSTDIEVNGEKASPYWLMQLDLNADMNTFRHEMVHFMKAAGIISPAQWARLEDEAKSIPGDESLEEKVAYMIENRIDNPMPGESKIVHNVVRLLDKLRVMTRFLNSRALWRGMESGALARGAQAQAPGEAVQEYSVQRDGRGGRARAGGEIGKNKDFYKGGQFLPSTEMPKKEREKILKAATGREQFERGFGGEKYAVPEPGKAPILRHYSSFMNEDYMANAGFSSSELTQLTALKEKYEAGERWFDVYEYPLMANFRDASRLYEAGMKMPNEILSKPWGDIFKPKAQAPGQQDVFESYESDISTSYSIQSPASDAEFMSYMKEFSGKDIGKVFKSRGMDGDRVTVRLNVDAKYRSGIKALKERGISTSGIKSYNQMMKALGESGDPKIRGELFEANSVQAVKSSNPFGSFLGKVLSYDHEVSLDNVIFGVDQSAWARAVKEGVKNVHAGVTGDINNSRKASRRGQRIFFIPHVANLFFDKNGRAVKGAKRASVIGGQVYATGIEYFAPGEAPIPKDKKLRKLKPKSYSIQAAPEGFKDLQDWEGFLRQSNNQGRWVTTTTEQNLRAPGDVYEAMISIRDGAENKAVAEMADVIAETVKDQSGRTSGFLMAGKRDDGMSSNALGTYWTQDDEVRLLKTERPRDLTTIHEVVHSFTAMAARQYTHGATDSTGTVGKSYLKRLGNLRDQIMKGERVVGKKPDYNLKRDVMKWVEVKEKIRPSGKDLAIANLIDLYLEGVEKIGPKGLETRAERKKVPIVINPTKEGGVDQENGWLYSIPISRFKDPHHGNDILNFLKKVGLESSRYDLPPKDYGSFANDVRLTKEGYEKLIKAAENPKNIRKFGGIRKPSGSIDWTEITGWLTSSKRGTAGRATGKGSPSRELGRHHYGWGNLMEFTAEAMSNPGFQAQLLSIDKGPAVNYRSWMSNGAKERDRMAKAARGIFEEYTSVATGQGPMVPPKPESVIKTAQGRHTMLDAVAHAVADFGGIAKPSVEDFFKSKDATSSMVKPQAGPRYPQYSVQANQEYMEAAEAGNLEEAENMVAQAAKAAGYTIGPVWHGSRSEKKFNEFDTFAGAYFTTDNDFAEGYRDAGGFFDEKGPMYNVYIKPGKSRTLDGEDSEAFEKFTGIRNESSELVRQGINSEILKFADGEFDIRVTDPSQIKSADPITKDDDGNIIPLSERFQTESDDIRYSVQGEQYVSNVLSNTGKFGDMYSRVVKAVKDMDMKKGTVQQWVGRLKKLSEGVPKAYRVSDKDFPAGEKAFDSQELEELGIDDIFSPGTELTKEELLKFIEDAPVPEITFEPLGIAATQGTKWEGMELEQLQELEKIQWAEAREENLAKAKEDPRGSWTNTALEEANELSDIITRYERGIENVGWNFPEMKTTQAHGAISMQSPSAEGYASHVPNYGKGVVAWSRFNVGQDQWDFVESQSDLHQGASKAGYAPTKKGLKKWANTKWVPGLGTRLDPQGTQAAAENARELVQKAQAEIDELKARLVGDRINNHIGETVSENYYRLKQFESSEQADASNGESAWGSIELWTWPTSNGIKEQWQLRAPNFNDIGSSEVPYSHHNTFEEAAQAWKDNIGSIMSGFGQPNAVHKKSWHEANFRAVVQMAALHGAKRVAFPSKWQQVAEIEGHSQAGEKPAKDRVAMYSRMVNGTLAEAKRLAKKYGSKVVKTKAIGTVAHGGTASLKEYYYENIDELLEIIDANYSHFNHILDEQAAPGMDAAWPWQEVRDAMVDGDMEIEEAWRNALEETDRGGLEYAVDALIDSNDLMSLKHPNGGTVLDFQKKQTPPSRDLLALEVTPEMAGPMARYSVQGNWGLNILKGKAKPEGLPKNPTIMDVAHMFQDAFDSPIIYQEDNPRQNARVEASLENEIKHAYKLHPEAAGWYDENLSLAVSVLKEADPEIVKPANKFIFGATLAITSDGNKVDGQFGQAWDIYQEWKKTGKLNPKLAFGDRQGNIRKNLVAAMGMFEKYGPEKATEMLIQVRSVGGHVDYMVNELGIDKKIANDLKGKVGELVSSEVPFAAMMFGPKLGSFFSNLEGDYSNITMDRWFMRTIGRLTGTYLKPVDLNAPRGTKAKPKPSALDRLRQAIRAISSEERKELGINTRSASGEKGAIDTAKKMSRYFGHPKLGAKRRGLGVKAGGSATWNEARNSANSIVVLLKPVVDTPENGSHRAWIRTRMNNVRVKLASQGIHLENADIQALLWYSEKELYDKLGIKGPKGANDYASASEGVHRRVRGRPSRSYARGTGQVGGIGSGRPGKKGSGVGDFSVQSDQVSPEAQARINHIEAGGSYHAPPPEAAPAYGSSYITDFQKRHFARPSQKLVYFAGSKVGEEKTRLQIEEAYAAAAVRKAQVEVSRQLTDQAYKAQSGLKLPKWMNTGKWAKRLNEFMDKSVHLAAHLNATSRDTRGNLVFTDFEMRAGLMKEKEFNKGSHQVGDRIIVINPLTQENDELAIGSFITTPDGRSGYQLLRVMEAARQEEIYNHFKTEYPDLIWSIDMYIDPALKDTREVINGVEVPAFNRFSLERLMEEADPAFEGVPGYTPDVMATRSLIGGILGIFNPGAGSRSPGRKYKTGKAREGGLVQDLFSGHSIRAFQAIQEKHRQRFRDIVLRDAAVPLEQGESPENLPEGWVMLEAGMNDLIQRVKKFRGFIEEETIDGTEFYRKFVGELYAKRGRQLKMRKEAVEVLMQQYIRIQFNNRLYNMGGWMVRNSKAMLLAHPGTMFVNAATNDLFTFEKAFQEMVKGVSLLPTNPTEGKISLRMSKELMVGNFLHRFPSLRKMAGLTSYYDEVVEEAIPEEIFAGSVSLQDLDVKYEVGAGQYLREGEIGAASLQLLQYGNIDVRAKQRMTYAFLKAHAVQGAKDQGLKGQALKDAVDRFMKNPPRDIMVKAVDAANLEYLNYADSPKMLQWFAATPYTALIMPFPRFGYHFMAKQITKAAAVKDLLGKVPAEKRADAFGKLMAFSMFGLGGTGLILDMLLRDDDDDDEARERIGTNYTKYTDPITGESRTRQIDREMITTARVNLSWYAQRMGLGTESEQDFWWRVRNYPMIAMAGNAILAESDARNHGAWEGAKTYIRNTTDLSKDFFSLGAGFKVPSKVLADIHSEPGRPKKEPAFDPYATNVPLNFYLVEQGLTSFVPGTRQMGDLAALIQTDRPKKTASKTLGYEPGAWESIRANHLGAVLSRWAEKEGLIEPLPRQGSVVNMSITGSRSDSLERRIQRMEGLGKLGGPESNIYLDPRSYKPRLATIPESSIPERTRSLELMRILGLNLKPVKRGAYEEQIRPLPQFPGTSR